MPPGSKGPSTRAHLGYSAQCMLRTATFVGAQKGCYLSQSVFAYHVFKPSGGSSPMTQGSAVHGWLHEVKAHKFQKGQIAPAGGAIFGSCCCIIPTIQTLARELLSTECRLSNFFFRSVLSLFFVCSIARWQCWMTG